jgi:hypothetical protein
MIFVRVNKAPTELRADEYVINAPDFLDDIKKAPVKRPTTGVVSVNYLRQLVSDIGNKYIGQGFNALTDVNVSNYKGTPCANNEQVHETLLTMFKKTFPKMLNAYVEYHIKSRPSGTRVIYFLGGGNQVEPFLTQGFDEVLEKDLEKVLGLKPKKVVGKPAITDEEATKKTETVV